MACGILGEENGSRAFAAPYYTTSCNAYKRLSENKEEDKIIQNSFMSILKTREF